VRRHRPLRRLAGEVHNVTYTREWPPIVLPMATGSRRIGARLYLKRGGEGRAFPAPPGGAPGGWTEGQRGSTTTGGGTRRAGT